MAKFIPLLDDYVALLDRMIVSIEQVGARVAANPATIKLAATIQLNGYQEFVEFSSVRL